MADQLDTPGRHRDDFVRRDLALRLLPSVPSEPRGLPSRRRDHEPNRFRAMGEHGAADDIGDGQPKLRVLGLELEHDGDYVRQPRIIDHDRNDFRNRHNSRHFRIPTCRTGAGFDYDESQGLAGVTVTISGCEASLPSITADGNPHLFATPSAPYALKAPTETNSEVWEFSNSGTGSALGPTRQGAAARHQAEHALHAGQGDRGLSLRGRLGIHATGPVFPSAGIASDVHDDHHWDRG